MNILYITRSPPYPPNIGGNQRTAALYRALARHGEVDLFLAVDESELPASHLAEIRQNYHVAGFAAPATRGQSGIWRRLRSLAPALVDRTADYMANRRRDYEPDTRLATVLKRLMEVKSYNLVVGKGLSLAMKTGISPVFPYVLDVDDAEQEWFCSQIDSPYAGHLSRLVAAWRWAQLKGFVPDLYRSFSRCWVVKNRDRLIPGLENAMWLGVPLWPPQDGGQPAPEDDAPRRTVIMLGSYYHRPNAEGLDWFVRNVWPQVNESVPDAGFHIIGPGLSAGRVGAYSRLPGVKVIGAVPSVASHYRGCAFTVAPIWTGAGINVKVFESYAYGRTCVLTPFAYRGYEDCLENGVSACVAKSPDDFARACIDLLRDPARRDRLAATGHPRIMQDFSFDRFASVVDKTIHNIKRNGHFA